MQGAQLRVAREPGEGPSPGRTDAPDRHSGEHASAGQRAALSGRDALTPSERRVARLAADGLSNREVARTLFVTMRTVEGHLTETYAKLAIGSRDRLAMAL